MYCHDVVYALRVLVDDFLGQSQVVLGTCGVGIVEDDRQTVAWSLGELDIALDDGLENELLEVALHLIVDLIG
jgi:hypothetical protein